MSTEQRTSADGQLTGSLPEFLAFQWFVTPWVIQVLFWLGVGSVVIGAIMLLVAALTAIFNQQILLGLGMMFVAMAVFVIGLILVRVYCELIILVFKLYDRLGEISRKLG